MVPRHTETISKINSDILTYFKRREALAQAAEQLERTRHLQNCLSSDKIDREIRQMTKMISFYDFEISYLYKLKQRYNS